MNQYRIIVSRELTQHTVILVDAPDEDTAERRAKQTALHSNLSNWVDDDKVLRVEHMDVLSKELIG